jgi:hypothetical protein
MKLLAYTAAVLSFVSVFSTSLAFADAYPKNPAPEVTPGSLCTRPTSVRYPEKIAYCERNVSYDTKIGVINEYERRFGYNIMQTGRGQFKIDHYIPLCMGGSNESNNLWPQHMTVYEITDPLEEALCTAMADGKLKQADAVNFIKQAKNHLDEAPGILRRIRAL